MRSVRLALIHDRRDDVESVRDLTERVLLFLSDPFPAICRIDWSAVSEKDDDAGKQLHAV